jgi:hypothetical protein
MTSRQNIYMAVQYHIYEVAKTAEVCDKYRLKLRKNYENENGVPSKYMHGRAIAFLRSIKNGTITAWVCDKD